MSSDRAGAPDAGFLLLDAALTVFVVGICLTALIAMIRLELKAGVDGEAAVVSAHLSQRLLEEVRLRRWDRRTPLTPPTYTRRTSPVGVCCGADPADKTTFGDVGAFDGWRESPPQDPMGRPLPEFAAYSSSVTVRYVDPATLAPLGGSQRSDFKRVSVCTRRQGRAPVCLDTIFTNR
ncbi:MAG: hypothetical protein HY079_11505 [Elusimicrobia bacterium]|nr:hypothetical protein [Elusimicrobiota bacterium]